ncbi:MAG: hypothetical protein KC496_12230 [Anaerolineae bacterium]|nr:hypothetical protein [Anaerolineae bacterium]
MRTGRKLTETQMQRRARWVRILSIVLMVNIGMSLFVIWSISQVETFSNADFGNGMLLMALGCFFVGGSHLASSVTDPRQASRGYTPPLEPEQITRLSEMMTENMREGRQLFAYAMASAVLALLIGLVFNFLA